MESKNKEHDCLSCRLVSSGGLALGSLLLYSQSTKQKTTINRIGILLVSAGM